MQLDEIDENWIIVQDNDRYEVSNWGRVKNLDTEHIIAPFVNHQGFPSINLFDHQRARTLRQINKLVAKAFVLNDEPRLRTGIWHIDGDLLNCRSENIKWEQRTKVLEWNRMHRDRHYKYFTMPVMNNETGEEYLNAFEAAMAMGMTETDMLRGIELNHIGMFSGETSFRYVREKDRYTGEPR